MKKAIKDSKWYWYLPVVWLFCTRQMSKWTFQPDNSLERLARGTLVELLMFPTLFVFMFIIIKYYS